MPTDPYGASMIVLHKNSASKINIRTEGELIAIEKDTLFILTNENVKRGKIAEGKNIIIKIEKNHIQSFILHYAKFKAKRAYMFSSAFIPFHGIFLLVTIPYNLLTFFFTEKGENNYFSLNHKNIEFWQLYQFARYPQGIPEGLDMDILQPRQDNLNNE